MTKLSIILAAVLGLTFTPFPCAEAGPPHIAKGQGSSGQRDEDEERLLEDVLRLLGPDAGSSGQRNEDEERLLEELLRLLDPDAVQSSEMSEGEEEDEADRDDRPGHQGKGHGKDRGHLKKLSQKVRGNQAGSSAGVAKGDFNGDGFADLAVGVPFEDIPVTTFDPLTGRPILTINIADAGAVNVIYGSGGGLTATSTTVPASQFWSQESAGILDNSQMLERFGTALAAGDFNGDGISDLAIAIPQEHGPIASEPTVGAVQILYGVRDVGLTSAGNQIIRLPELFAAALTESLLRVGNSLVWGDFNGDGFGDLAVEGQNIISRDNARVSVLFGSTAGLNRGIQRVEFEFLNAGELGSSGTDVSLAAGKLNTDSFDDLVVGLPLANIAINRGTARDAGAVHILFGSSAGPTTTGRQIIHQNTLGVPDTAERGDQFGFAVAVGDFNGDGTGDLAVGVPFENVDLQTEGGLVANFVGDAGAVHVFFGSASGVTITGNQFFQQGNPALPGDRNAEENDQFGFALAAGDFNDDNVADLAIGAPGETLGGNANAGAVSVRYGAAGVGVTTTAGPGEQFWNEGSSGINATTSANNRFGSSLTAWDFGRRQILGIPIRIVTAADLAIGIPGKDILIGPVNEGGGSIEDDAGAVRVIYGSISGLSTATGLFGSVGPSQLWTQESSGVPDQAEDRDGFGSALY